MVHLKFGFWPLVLGLCSFLPFSLLFQSLNSGMGFGKQQTRIRVWKDKDRRPKTKVQSPKFVIALALPRPDGSHAVLNLKGIQ